MDACVKKRAMFSLVERAKDMPQEASADHSEEVVAMLEHAERAFWVAQRITGSAHLAEEVVQETLVELLRRPPTEKGVEKMRFCFFRSVRLNAWDARRKELNRRKREMKVSKERPPIMEAPRTDMEKNELPEAAQAAVAGLPVEEREAVHLCCEQGLSLRSAAELLGIPMQTLDKRVHRGLQKLRKALAAQGFTAATPLAVSAALSSIPLPPLPATFATTLQSAAANPSAFVAAHAVSQSLRTAGLFAAHKTALTAVGLTLCVATLSGGVWLFSDSREPENETAAQNEEQKKSVIAPDENHDLLYRRWSFADGPATDLAPLEGQWHGKWRWTQVKDGAGRTAGCMEIVKEKPEDYCAFGLPLEFSPRPLRLTFKGIPVAIKKGQPVFHWGLRWTTPSFDTLPFKSWSKEINAKNTTRPTCEIYVVERWIFSIFEGVINTIIEYPEEYPTKHLLFSFDSMFLEEVELREMRPEEIRPYVEMLETKLTELKKANIALKEQLGLRRRPDGTIEQWR